MKPITYPRRLTVAVPKKHGQMLDQLCEKEHLERPACLLKALELLFASTFSFSEREELTVRSRRRAAA